MKRDKTVVLYHKNCMDGVAAAYVALCSDRVGEDAMYLEVQHGDPVPDCVDGARVYLLDFCFPSDALRSLVTRAKHTTIIDHHKTSARDLEALRASESSRRVHINFDPDYSGCVLAWYHFDGRGDVPDILRYVQDRDLWRWEMDESRAINAALRSYGPRHPREFARLKIDFDTERERVRAEGRAILRQVSHAVRSITERAYLDDVAGHTVPVVCTSIYQSEVCERLLEEHPDAPFAASFFVDEHDARIYSLRSRGRFDVGALAKTLGGGGHASAAAFRSPKPVMR